MSYETILYEQRGPVALITNNRPERRNAWSVKTYRETVDAITRANADPAIGAIVLTGAEKIFSAGADFKAPPEPPDDKGRVPTVATLSMAQDTSWLHLLARSKPNIVAVNGHAIGLGATLTLAADIRVAAESALFSFPFLSLGTMPELGCTALLPRLVGFGRALDICLRSDKLDAAEALRVGLVTRVVPDDKLLDEALSLGAKLAGYPALQVKLTKEMFYSNVEEGDINALLKRESLAFIAMMKAAKTKQS